jgi:hypothetical protein
MQGNRKRRRESEKERADGMRGKALDNTEQEGKAAAAARASARFSINVDPPRNESRGASLFSIYARRSRTPLCACTLVPPLLFSEREKIQRERVEKGGSL